MRFLNLKMEFRKLYMSVEQVAQKTGFVTMSLYNKLNGKTEFTLDEMLILRDFINSHYKKQLTLDYLFKKTK